MLSPFCTNFPAPFFHWKYKSFETLPPKDNFFKGKMRFLQSGYGSKSLGTTLFVHFLKPNQGFFSYPESPPAASPERTSESGRCQGRCTLDEPVTETIMRDLRPSKGSLLFRVGWWRPLGEDVRCFGLLFLLENSRSTCRIPITNELVVIWSKFQWLRVRRWLVAQEVFSPYFPTDFSKKVLGCVFFCKESLLVLVPVPVLFNCFAAPGPLVWSWNMWCFRELGRIKDRV